MAVRVRRKNRRQVDPTQPPASGCVVAYWISGNDGEAVVFIQFADPVLVSGLPALVVDPNGTPVAAVSFVQNEPTIIEVTFASPLDSGLHEMWVPENLQEVRGSRGGLWCGGLRQFSVQSP